MAYQLMIQNGGAVCFPVVEEGVTWDTERKNTPGKLSFSVVKDAALNFQEGNLVQFAVDGKGIFKGFVFTKRRDKSGLIQVTAYDQLRYLKNKDSILENGITASSLLKRLAADFRLQLGEVEDTGYVIDTVDEEDSTLFDMLQEALGETLAATGKLYCLYDDFGALTLKNAGSQKLAFCIDAASAEDLDYSSSIDDGTYDKVKLSYENDKTGKREQYVVQNGEHMNLWGVLQYHESIRSQQGAAAKAEALLKFYDQKTRRLSVKGVLGDPAVRAGCTVGVNLNLGDVVTQNYMLVEKARHTFKESEHRMDLDLLGGEFIA